MVKFGPVATSVPPASYQCIVAPASAVAVNVAVLFGQIVAPVVPVIAGG